jgi:8-oxo-dGTP pyrophosphatase MutT (NUDIX family)
MTEIHRAGSSAVAIIETPDSFLAEGRPEIAGQLAHSGKIGLFGGHIEPDQTPYDAIRAELGQELNLRIIGPLQLIEDGDFPSQNRRGEEVIRNVSLFHVAIGGVAELNMKVPGSIVHIPKTIEGIEAYKDQVTPFTLRVLSKMVSDRLANK